MTKIYCYLDIMLFYLLHFEPMCKNCGVDPVTVDLHSLSIWNQDNITELDEWYNNISSDEEKVQKTMRENKKIVIE